MQQDLDKLKREGVKEDLSRRQAVKLVKEVLVDEGFNESSIKHITKPFKKKVGILSYFAILIIIISLGLGIFKLTNVGQAVNTGTSGFTSAAEEKIYTDSIGLDFISNNTYTWFISN